MRKLYLSLLPVFILTAVSFGQRKISDKIKTAANNPIIFSPLGPAGPAGSCDTLNYDSTWFYYLVSLDPEEDGYFAGNNSYGDKEKANFFDASGTTYFYLSGALIGFGKANCADSLPDNLSKNVIFRVYDGGTGASPGTELGTVEMPLSQIKADVDAASFTEVIFPTPIQLPASKTFYVSVDVSNFIWAVGDSVSLLAALDENGEEVVAVNQAWEQWDDDSWHTFSEYYLIKTALSIFPILNTDQSACITLPVHLLSFTSQRHNNDVTLNWQVADEIGMKGYEVQKSGNNGAYSTIAFVPALNNAKNQAYSTIDRNAFSSSATVQYRLKQIDGDGSVKYSRVLQVKSGSAINDVVFANPFNGALKLNLNLASAQKVSVFVYDMQGRLVASLPQKMYDASANNLIVQGTENLKPGLYSVKVIAGGEQKVYKAMKQ